MTEADANPQEHTMSAARKSIRNAQIAAKWRHPTTFRDRPLRAVWVEEDGSGPCWGPAPR